MPSAAPAPDDDARDTGTWNRLERDLDQSQQRLRAVLDATSDAIYTTDLETGRFVEVNRAFGDIMGYAPEEMLGRTSLELNLWVSLEDRQAYFEEIKTRGATKNWVFRARHRDGRIIWSESTSTVLKLDGRPCMVTVSRDVTERKRAEEEKERLQAQLHQAQKMESVGRLAGGIAHDFNNLLGVILGHTELALAQTSRDAHLREDLESIRGAAERSASLTRRLLAFARKQTVARRELSLNDTVAQTLGMLTRLIGETIQLRWAPSSESWRISADPSQVDQLLTNLCVNARDAISGRGEIHISTRNVELSPDFVASEGGAAPGEYVQLDVRDTGSGMSAEVLAHLFEPFFTTKPVGEGTGLGLSTVYGIVKQNQGLIRVQSAPGQGSTFSVYLPRSAGPRADGGREEAPGVAGGRETVLLVEDEPRLLKVLTTSLAQLGYTVLAAPTPPEALRLAREHADQLRLLLTDVVMPEMNGRDLAERLRAEHPHLRCLFMSGYAADVIDPRGFQAGATRLLQKPFTQAELAAAVRAALDEARAT